MKSAIVALVGLALVATSLALPVGFNVGLDLKPGDADFWKKDITIGGQKIQLGMGWNNNGVISAAAKFVAKVNDQDMPITAAVSTSQDMKQLNYQVGSKYADMLSGIVYGDSAGTVQYQVNAKVPVKTEGSPVSAIGASLEGSGLAPATLTGGVALGKEVVQAKVDFVDFKPVNVNVGLGTDM
uniref:DNA mismatch repair protein mutH n=1 Tax=Lygus hesperus TaxID=30085 RepID=A0A0A9XLY5_LYGHE